MFVEYSSEVLRRFNSPNTIGGSLQDRRSVFGAEGEDRTLNVWIRIELEIVDGKVGQASCQVFGCPHTIAAAHWVIEWVRGRQVDRVRQLDIHSVADQLGVPVHKLGKLLRIEDALLQCIERYTERESERNQ